MTVARTIGSYTLATLPPTALPSGPVALPGTIALGPPMLGKSLGLVTVSSAPDSMTTR